MVAVTVIGADNPAAVITAVLVIVSSVANGANCVTLAS